MNCIDAIEGTVKCIIDRLHSVNLADRMDDTEYIRDVKSVIEATELFIKQNVELMSEPKMIRDVLYAYARELWLKNLSPPQLPLTENDGYHEYCFDYIFNHGVYPR